MKYLLLSLILSSSAFGLNCIQSGTQIHCDDGTIVQINGNQMSVSNWTTDLPQGFKNWGAPIQTPKQPNPWQTWPSQSGDEQ